MGGPEIVKWSTDNNVVSQDKNKQTKKRKEKHFVWYYYMMVWLSPKEMAQPRTSFPGLFPKTNGRGKSLGTRLEKTDQLQLTGVTTDILGARGGGGGDLVSLIARVRNSGVREKQKFLCTCKSHRHCSFYNYLLILTMDRKRLKIIRL